MKKLELLLIAIILTVVGIAQNPIFEENFDSLGYGDPPPTGWTNYYMADFTGSNQWKATGSGYNGSFALNHNYFYNASQYADNWVVTPQIAIGPNDVLSFIDYVKPYSPNSTFGFSSVLVSTGSPLPSDSDFVQVMTFDTTILELWKTNIVDLSPFSGNIYIAFKYEGEAYEHKWIIDDVVVVNSYKDGGISDIVSPSGIFFPGGMENVLVKLKNYGNQIIDSVTINWMVNGINQTPYIANGLNILVDDSVEIDLGQFDFSNTGTYTIEAIAIINGDSIFYNNTASGTYIIMATIDIGVIDISPRDGFPVIGNIPVITTVKNYGTAVANDFLVNWYVNGISQTTFAVTNMNLLPGASVEVNVGTYNFGLGDNEISALTNNINDIDNTNDSTSVIARIGYLWESFEGNIFPPVGWSTTYAMRETNFLGAYHGDWYYAGESATNMFGSISDTLFTPLLDIVTGDSLSFAVRINDFFPVNFKVIYKEGNTGIVIDLQTIQSSGVPYTYHTIDLTPAEGTNYIGFVSQTNGNTGPVNIDMISSTAAYHINNFDLNMNSYDAIPVSRVNSNDSVVCVIKNTGSNIVSGIEYNINLINSTNTIIGSVAGVDINPWEEVVIEIPYLFASIGDNKIVAQIDYFIDQDQTNNTSDTFHIFSVPATTIDDEIGQPIYVNLNFPTDASGSEMTMGEDDISQTLYLSSEVDAGYIYGFELKYLSIYHGKRILPMKIMIAETSLTNMSGDFIPYNDFTMVFDGEIEVKSDTNFIYFSFDSPYLYTGVSNLVVQFYQYDPEWPSIATRFIANGSAPEVRTHSMINVFNLDPTNPGVGGNYFHDYPYTIFVTDTLTDIGVISGNVYNSTGTGIPNATIEVLGTVVSTQTFGSGQYELPALPYGTYDIKANAFMYEEITQPVIINQPNVNQDFYLELKPLVEISGIVEGSNAPGVPLQDVDIDITGYASFSGTSNALGGFVINQLFGNADYNLTLTKFGYYPLNISVSLINQPMNMGTLVLQEEFISAFNVEATDLGSSSLITWSPPTEAERNVIQIDTDTISWSYTNEAYEDVWLGNFFENNEEITISDIEVVFDIYPQTPDYVTIDIFDQYQNLIVSSLPFLTAVDTVMIIDVPNISITDSYYAMIHWKDIPLSTEALAIDYSVNIPNVAHIKYPGDNIYLLNSVIGGWDGAFLLRTNVISESTALPCNILGYNIYRGLFDDYESVSSWPVLNSNIISNTDYTDYSWTDLLQDGKYAYAVEAIYEEGNAEVTFSNSINGLVEINEFNIDEINVYPIPATNALNFENVEDSKITVYNILGEEIQSVYSKDTLFTLSVSHYSEGVYMVHILKNNKLFIKKIQIQ